MKVLIDTYKNTGNIHHAYLLEGGEEIRPELFAFFENQLKTPVQGNPDFSHSIHDTFSVDEARALVEKQTYKAINAGKKIFVVELRGITIEAQNALLKVIEEPTSNTHFFIIAPTRELFLPTLRSRLSIISSNLDGEENKTDQSKEEQKFIKDFISASKAERLEMTGDIIEEKDKARAMLLIDGLIEDSSKKGDRNSSYIKELIKLKGYLNDRSPSLKLILEHASLIS